MRGFVGRGAREMRGSPGGEGQPVIKGSPGVVKDSQCMQGCREVRGSPGGARQGCQSAGGYNKGPGVERPRGQGLCI